jgi:hypothetical protein
MIRSSGGENVAAPASELILFVVTILGVLVSEEDFDSFIARAEKIIANML